MWPGAAGGHGVQYAQEVTLQRHQYLAEATQFTHLCALVKICFVHYLQ
jgi:hypothetical protein